MMATVALDRSEFARKKNRIDAAWYRRERRFAELPVGRVAYVERGRGPAALFVHGYPLNGFQWRGAIERLHALRRCIAPDVMGMGFTQTPEGQMISPVAQATMLAMLLDTLHVEAADFVANDSGGLVAQLFLAKYPQRVRTLLLTNCDVDKNSPPPQFLPFIEQARKGTFVDDFIVPQLKDKELARSAKGMGGLAYTHPESLEDETIETYFQLPAARGDSPQESTGQSICGFNGNEFTHVHSRSFASMEGARANGMGAEGWAFRRGMGGMAGPNAAGFARCTKGGRSQLVLSGRDAGVNR